MNKKHEEYKNKEWLTMQLDKCGTISEIARQTGYNRKTIARYIKEFDIKTNRYDTSHRKYHFDDRFFEKIDSEEKAYWLGFLTADGCLYHHKTSYDIQFNLNEKDIDHLMNFAQSIKSDKQPKLVKQGKHNCAFFRISSKRMFDNLHTLGITVKKTGKEIIPNIPYDLIRHFIRGYFDGDGCISKHKTKRNETYYTMTIVCSNENFLYDISTYIEENTGLHFNVYPVQNNAFILNSVAKKKNYHFYKFLYKDATIYLKRKFEIVQEFFNNYSPICE